MITLADEPKPKPPSDLDGLRGRREYAEMQKTDVVYTELGVVGLEISGGRVFESRLQNFKGTRRAIVIREMSETDSTVKGLLSNFTMLGRAVPFTIEAGGDTAADEQAAEHVKECLSDMETSWSDTLTAILSMLPFGFSILEQNFKWRRGDEPGTMDVPDVTKPNSNPGGTREVKLPASNFNDNKIGWWGWPIRLQETIDRWETDESGRVTAVIQRAKNVLSIERRLPIEKVLHFRTSAARGNPEGESILEAAYRSWYFKRNFEEIVGVGVKRDLTGIVRLKVPKEWGVWTAAGADKLRELEKFVANVQRDEYEGAVHPNDCEMDLLASPGSRQFDVVGLINMLRLEIAIGMLTEFALIGHEGSGSYALKREATRIFLLALQGILESSVAETINRFAIPPLVKLNGFQVTGMPTLRFGNVDVAPVQEIIDSLVKMANMGAPIFPNTELMEHLLGMLRVPKEEAIELQEEKAEQGDALRDALLNNVGDGAESDDEDEDEGDDDDEAGEDDEDIDTK